MKEISSVNKAPRTVFERLRFIGPSAIVTGSVVGSGSIVMTPLLGAAAGFTLLWWLLLCRQRIGDQKRPVFDDFSPCRESHGEYFPVGIKSRAAVWRKLGLVHFLAFSVSN